MSWSPFPTIDDICKFGIGVSWYGSRTFTYQIDHFFGMKLQIFKPHNESRIIRIQIFLVPCRPVMGQGIVRRGWFILDRHGNMIFGKGCSRQGKIISIRDEVGTMFFRSGPLGRIWMLALTVGSKKWDGIFTFIYWESILSRFPTYHTLHPTIWISNNGNRQNIGFIDLVVVPCCVGPFSRCQRVFAPRDLPSCTTMGVMRVVWHDTIGFDVHGKRVGPRIEHSC